MYIEHGISNLGHIQVIGIWQYEREYDVNCGNSNTNLIIVYLSAKLFLTFL